MKQIQNYKICFIAFTDARKSSSLISKDVFLCLEVRHFYFSEILILFHALKLISDWQYRSFCIELGRRGYRQGEPIGIDRETSIVWQKVFSQLWSEKTTKQEVADELHIPLVELESIVFGVFGYSSNRQESSNPASPLQAIR